MTLVWLRDLKIEPTSILDIAARYLIIEDHHDVEPFRILWRKFNLQKHISDIASGRKIMYDLDENPKSKTTRASWLKRQIEIKAPQSENLGCQ